ncbi:MAG: PAS domain-containing protein, partial [Calditrichaeota bacterium]|nr:PAS domain-containing protein [Calditrichota bacterium]
MSNQKINKEQLIGFQENIFPGEYNIRWFRVLRLFLESPMVLPAIEDEDKVLVEVCQKVAGSEIYKFCCIAIIKSEGSEEDIRQISSGISEKQFNEFIQEKGSLLGDLSRIKDVFKDEISVINWKINSGVPDKKLTRLAQKYNFKSFIIIPLRENFKLLGLIAIYSEEPELFHDIEIKLFQNIAGNLTYAISSLRTKRNLKKIREDLQESRQMLQLVMDTIPVRLFWKDKKFRYLGCNKAFATDAGLNSPEEIIGKNDFELSWKETAPLYRSDDQEIIAKNISKINYEEPQVRENGKQLWLRTTKIPLINENGEVIGLFGSYEDITEKKNAEEALWESERRYKMATTAGSVGVWDWDMKTGEIFIDPILKALLGYDDYEIENNIESWIKHVHPDDLTLVRQRVEDYIKGRTNHLEVSYRMLHREGRIKWFQVSGTFLTDKEGEPYRMIGTTSDISRHKELENEQENMRAQLLQAQKMEAIGTLAGGMAHDFNNLLTSIKGYTDLSLMNIRDLDMLERNMKQIQKSVQRAGNLTNQLLLFSRKQMMSPSSININEIIRNMLMMLERVIGEDIEIKTDLNNKLWKIWADEGNIEQVIMNLAVNARDAMPKGGLITLNTHNIILTESDVRNIPKSRPGKFVIFRFSDTGEGMSEEIVNHIFEPFFTTKEVGKGTGLGLSVIYGIISQHEGWINVDSKLKEGTTFTIYFPATFKEAGEATAEKLSLQDFQGNGEVILLVEDDSEIRDFIVQALNNNGYRVYAVSNYSEALRVYDQQKEDIRLVFSDVVLPDRNGLELIEELLRKDPHLSVILSSGYTGEKSNWERI